VRCASFKAGGKASKRCRSVRGFLSNIRGARACKRLSDKQRAEKDEADERDLEVPSKFDMQGAKLDGLTQNIAYAGIRERIDKAERRRTKVIITKAIEEADGDNLQKIAKEDIWKGMKASTIRPNIREFLYEMAHDTYLLGDRWSESKKPKRASCKDCGHENETMDHIFFQCENPIRSAMWKLAEHT
jgi:Zn finger protein HypA/HybF involved in hydrogenase expression